VRGWLQFSPISALARVVVSFSAAVTISGLSATQAAPLGPRAFQKPFLVRHFQASLAPTNPILPCGTGTFAILALLHRTRLPGAACWSHNLLNIPQPPPGRVLSREYGVVRRPCLVPMCETSSAVCHATNMHLLSRADSCRASAMSDHFINRLRWH
jgi:hypothetical protein